MAAMAGYEASVIPCRQTWPPPGEAEGPLLAAAKLAADKFGLDHPLVSTLAPFLHQLIHLCLYLPC
jgi:hypothetical protein